jgi:site-specific DNA recombinase
MEPHTEGADARAAIYTRISKDLTLVGLGVARQLKDCRGVAERNGWCVLEELEDNDVSATNGKRVPLQSLMALVEAGAVRMPVAVRPRIPFI